MNILRFVRAATTACLITSAAIPFAAPGSAAAAQSGAASGAASKSYWAAVTADNVFVRSGPSVQSSYPFGKLRLGDMVEVLEESYGWAKVRCTGPAFSEVVGYVPADRRLTLAADGSTLTITAKTEVKAPNIGNKASPDASWKPIARLNPGDTLKVVGEAEGDREKVYKVVLPESAEGWVNLNFVRRATPAEVEASRAAPAKAPAMAAGGAEQAPAGSPKEPAGAKPKNARGGKTPGDSHVAGADRTAGTDASPSVTDDGAAGAPPPAPAGGAPAEQGREAEPAVVAKPRRSEPPALTPAQTEAAARRAAFEDLEAIWGAVKAEPLASAELGALRGRYLELLEQPLLARDIRAMATARVEQLNVKLELQERIYRLQAMRADLDLDLDRIRAVRLAIEARSDYDAVGVLNASTVYDGKRLPVLYRLQDPGVGQTVAYVVPKEDFQLSTMLGVLVGIKGAKRYDESLRVNIIEPRSIDILTQRKEPQATPVDAPAGPATIGASAPVAEAPTAAGSATTP